MATSGHSKPVLDGEISVEPSSQLHYRTLGSLNGPRPPLLLLHGLLGSSVNWLQRAAELVEHGYGCLALDLRNHGYSFHDDVMDYPSMTADVVRLLDELNIKEVMVLGHSMGAKVGMWLALEQPWRVERLVAVDMAPTKTPNRFGPLFAALKGLDLKAIGSRAQADAMLAHSLDNARLRAFLLQNLQYDERGGWQWRANVQVLDRALGQLLEFPRSCRGAAFQGPALFVYGGRSDYLTETAAPAIRTCFPYARLRAIAGAGHWVQTDQPRLFLQALLAFL